MDDALAQLYQSPKTIVTIKDLALIWQETNSDHLKARASYYVKRGALKRLRRGVFAKGKNYDPRELATSIYTPCYISFETSLREAGIIFQHYETIFVAGPLSKTITIDKYTFTFRTLKESVLYNSAGIIKYDTYGAATPERAFLDMIYIMPSYYFDHLDNINWEKCHELAHLYRNRRLIKRLTEYQHDTEAEQER